MIESIYPYYERELLFIREQSQEFARQYPGAAGRLLLEANRSSDPHVERLIESFALLTARVQKKLDDDFPELTDALLHVLYPHYLAPIPSLAMVEFEPDPANPQASGVRIPRGSHLESQRLGDLACLFRTCYSTTVWPLEVEHAGVESPPFADELAPPAGTACVLRMRLGCQADLRFEQMPLETLRFHLGGDDHTMGQLYQLLFNHALRVEFRSVGDAREQKSITLSPAECLRQVGFAEEEGLLPYPKQSFMGYRLLTELFTFPQKFLFFDLGGFDRVAAEAFGRKVDVLFYLDRYDQRVDQQTQRETFRLGATPIVNLFDKICEPIALAHTKTEYAVKPDVRHPLELEVYSVDRVTTIDPENTREYRPFYAIAHDNAWNPDDEQETFWYASRRDSALHGDDGTDVYLHLVDLNFDPHRPAESVVSVHATCTNRDLPTRLQLSGEELKFHLQAAVPIRGIRCLRKPTSPMRPPMGRGSYWRLVSHLSLNHLSLTEPEEAKVALKEILRLYDFSDKRSGHQRTILNRQMIEGIVGLGCRRAVTRVGGALSGGVCRGIAIDLELDEEKYIGLGSFLFASVMERFLALYGSVNSFTQLVASTPQNGPLKKWPPRAGEAPLI